MLKWFWDWPWLGKHPAGDLCLYNTVPKLLFSFHISTTMKCLFMSFIHFLIGLFVVYCSFDYLFYIQVLCVTCDLQIFSALPAFVFSPYKLSLSQTEVFNLLRYHFSTVDCTLGVTSKNSFPSPRSWRFYPIFFPKIFIGFLRFLPKHFIFIWNNCKWYCVSICSLLVC